MQEAWPVTRSLVVLRDAEVSDAPFLAELWSAALRRADVQEQVADLELVVKASGASMEQRIVVAEYDGQPAGAVLLRITTVTPLNLEPVVQVLSPTVLPQHRRHGVGRMLMEAAVQFAEDAGIPQCAAAAASGSRDGNRFMARLALAPLATYRVAPTAAVRARLTAQRPTLTTAPSGGRHLTRVLAARRSQRRSSTGQATPPVAPSS
jgi:GNAT superfamily N-acetyltransferase